MHDKGREVKDDTYYFSTGLRPIFSLAPSISFDTMAHD